MTVVFDAEPLIAFAFDEPGAEAVEEWLDRVYDGDRAGYVATITLAEVRYVAARKASPSRPTLTFVAFGSWVSPSTRSTTAGRRLRS
ncbi:type II toxin-antitoxin system VapC family toxin [Halonotius sp. GCM10025705]|uniref:type II toxin-antitoxin system VapC family toxin n=1 Tax=Halonotius sp. GCM10025705 TaxID=3252678 RepID=UPI003617551E